MERDRLLKHFFLFYSSNEYLHTKGWHQEDELLQQDYCFYEVAQTYKA